VNGSDAATVVRSRPRDSLRAVAALDPPAR